MQILRNTAAAIALAALPLSAVAVPIGPDESYTEVGTLAPGGTLVFSFEVVEDLDIDTFSVSATGTNSGDDIRNVTFAYDSVTGDTFDNVFSVGKVGAGFDFVPGFGPYAAGDTFSFTFTDGIVDNVGITLSFETVIPAAIPVPAAGGMLLLALLGAGAVARRRPREA